MKIRDIDSIKRSWNCCRNSVLFALVVILLQMTQSVVAQQNVALCPEKPKLVLMLVVDNLNNQQMDIVRTQCGSKGFNRIYGYGTQLTDAYYDAGGNFAGKNLATLFTGAPPATHGIVGRQWIDSFTGKMVDAIYGDVPQSGRFDTLAKPHNGALLCNTVANQIRKIYNDKAKIFSIGFDPQMLVWTSGTLAGEPIAWLDQLTGRVLTANVQDPKTTQWIGEFNQKGMVETALQKVWAPSKDINAYHQVRFFGQDQTENFYYPLNSPSNNKHYRYEALCGSPMGNSILRDLAASTIAFEEMGKDDIPDLLMVQFCTTPSVGQRKQPMDPETEDLLLCLDENIASLLQMIDGTVGMDNTLVIFTSARGAYDVANTDSPQWAERGVVSLRRATALLNLYLMAMHGQAAWVKSYTSGSVYLDKDLAKQKGVNYDSLLSESAEFLVQVKGIGDAFPARDLKTISTNTPVIETLRKNYHPKRSGDLLVYYEPGWAEEQDDGTKLTQLWGGEFVPLVFYGWKVGTGIVYERHNMVDLAPTLCSFIKVGLPDGCSGVPIPMGVAH